MPVTKKIEVKKPVDKRAEFFKKITVREDIDVLCEVEFDGKKEMGKIRFTGGGSLDELMAAANKTREELWRRIQLK